MDNQLAQEARGCYELLQRELAPGAIGQDVDAVALAIAKLARYGQALEAQHAPLYPTEKLVPSEVLVPDGGQ